MMSDFIDNLLSRMTLAEKIGQLNHLNSSQDTTGVGGVISNIEKRIRQGEVGALAGGVELARILKLQKIAIEESPHGIPLIFTFDVIHGYRTIFPLPLALACTWDTNLIRRIARAAAAEAAAAGIAVAWAPMADVSRDARWGRCAESPGEDPLLGSVFASAMIEGYQQGDLGRPESIMAAAKHFAGYGFAEGGRDYNEVDISAYCLHNVVFPPFRAAVDAGVGAIMVGFNDLGGIPCTAHRELLGGVLRGQWAFAGLIVSDYTAIMELVHHGVARDLKEAALLAFKAGVDMDMGSESYVRYLPELVAEGRICESDIDAACARVLRAKQRLALFEHPYRQQSEARRQSITLTPANRELAREAAAKACVLLKNNGVLPLARKDGIFAIVGPLADSRANMQGTWAVAAQTADSITVLEGMRTAVPESGRILYAKGANIVDDSNIAARLNVFGEIAAIDPRSPDQMIDEAIAATKRADVVIACVGEAREHTGESSTRTDISLPGSQQRLLCALHDLGKPIVLVTMSGRPLALEREDRHVDAILHCWFGGSEAGNAIADLLLGKVVPSGKLAMSFPRTTGQCPIYYAEFPTGRPIAKIGIDVSGDLEVDKWNRHVFRKFTTACRLEGAHTPLYPFGHGLSYTAFQYGELKVNKTVLRGERDRLTASISIRNIGSMAGEEIVQLYLSDVVASRSRPVRELKGFQKVYIRPRQKRTVTFNITSAELRFFRALSLSEPDLIWEPGTFLIGIGPNSQDLSIASIEWLAGQ